MIAPTLLATSRRRLLTLAPFALVVCALVAMPTDARMSDSAWQSYKAGLERLLADPDADGKQVETEVGRLADADRPEAVAFALDLICDDGERSEKLEAQRDKAMDEAVALDAKRQRLLEAGQRDSSEFSAVTTRLLELVDIIRTLNRQINAGCAAPRTAALALGRMRDSEAAAAIATACDPNSEDHRLARAAACYALGCVAAAGAHDRAAARSILTPRLTDDDEALVRVAAAEGLERMADKATIPALAKALRDEAWQVRLAALDALDAIANDMPDDNTLADCVDAVIDALADQDGRTLADMVARLHDWTGAEMGDNAANWRGWWNRVERDFRAGKRDPGDGNAGGATVTFYGIPVATLACVFVIDVSDSMNEPASETEFEGEVTGNGNRVVPRNPNGGAVRKIDVAKAELINAINDLPEETMFTVIAYNHLVEPLDDELMQAKSSNKKKVIRSVEKLEATGATNIFEALERAFRIGDKKGKDGGPSVRAYGENAFDGSVDTIFFLTDGKPTHGRIQDTDQILAEVGMWHEMRQVRVNVIGVGEDADLDSAFLNSLANRTGGTYRHAR